MKNDASLTYNVFLVIGDVIALIVGFAAAFIIRAASPVAVAHPMPGIDYLVILLALLPFWIAIFALLGLYNTTIYERRFSETARLLAGSFIGLLFMLSWDYLSLEAIFPAKLVPLYGFLIAFGLLVLLRNIARLVRTSLFRYGVGLTRVVLIGNTAMTRELAMSLTHHDSGYKVLGVVGYRKKLPLDLPVYGNFSSFLRATPLDLHGIVQTELYASEDRNAEILTYAQENHVSYRFVPGNNEMFVGNLDVELFRNSVPVIHVHHTALFGPGRIIKRLMDIVVGGVCLVLFSPLILLVVLLEKLTGSGSAFFTQTRLTRFNTPFKVYKFRTQYAQYDGTTPEEAFKMMGKPELARLYRQGGDSLPRDPRVTPLGRFLRATSLDELPQLWNVVRGDISLVGPRALIAQELQQFNKSHLILSVKSGLTGLAVVSGRRDISFDERRKLDLYYVQNWSLWLDFVIVLKTIRVVLLRIGAR